MRASQSTETRGKAIALLARREYAEKELEQKLLSRGFDPGDVVEVLATLKEEGLQDDARYTESYIHKRVVKGYGPVRISRELRERGISETLGERLMGEMDIDWEDRLQAVRLKKFGRQVPEDTREQARQSRFLQYRGFTSEQIRNVFR